MKYDTCRRCPMNWKCEKDRLEQEEKRKNKTKSENHKEKLG